MAIVTATYTIVYRTSISMVRSAGASHRSTRRRTYAVATLAGISMGGGDDGKTEAAEAADDDDDDEASVDAEDEADEGE